MRRLFIAVTLILVALALVFLSSCGGASAPTKAVQTQVTSDIKEVSAALQCVFTEKSLDLVGAVKSTKTAGDTIFVYRVAYTYDCTAQTGNSKAKGQGDVFYFATVDKNGKLVGIS